MKFETKILDKVSREKAPGKFLKLRQGMVHYQLEGPESGELIVLVHGFSSPMVVWDYNFDFLVQNGYRVLRFDLYGRGFSDRIKAKYDLNLFENQLMELLTRLNLKEQKFNLIGLSMGGGISVVFSERHPHFIKRLILVDPAGMPGEIKKAPLILKIPFLNRLIFWIIGLPLLIKGMPKDFFDYSKHPEYHNKYTDQMEFKGYRDAILSSILNFPMTGLEESYKTVGGFDMPVQLFWGELDTTIPYPMHQQVCSTIPRLKMESIPECGHMPQYERPEQFNKRLLAFLHSS